MIPKELTLEHLIAAMLSYDAEIRHTEQHGKWLKNKASTWAIEYNGLQYPPKWVIARAAGIGLHEFHGGPETNSFIARMGLTLVALEREQRDDGKTALQDMDNLAKLLSSCGVTISAIEGQGWSATRGSVAIIAPQPRRGLAIQAAIAALLAPTRQYVA